MKYYRKGRSVYNIGYHLIFSPKYRKPYLLKYEKQLKKSFMISSIKCNFMIAEMDIMPDHIHLFIKCKSLHVSLSKIVNHLKGFSSYSIRKNNSFLKRYKSFWSPSYFAESIGNISEKTVRKYIKNQKVNLKSNYRYSYLLLNSKTHIKGTVINKYINEKTQKTNFSGTLSKKQSKKTKTICSPTYETNGKAVQICL